MLFYWLFQATDPVAKMKLFLTELLYSDDVALNFVAFVAAMRLLFMLLLLR